MYIYVGYVLFDYAFPVCLGLNKDEVTTKTKEIARDSTFWVDKVKVPKTGVFEFDTV